MSGFTFVLGAAAVLPFMIYLGVPALLRRLGLQPRRRRPRLSLRGRRALVVTTSCDRLGPDGRATGVAAFEMTGPYYVFIDAGMKVDFASVSGGPIPIDPMTTRWPVAHDADRRFLRDAAARRKARTSSPVSDVDFVGYDIVFIAGGWGAAYDLADSRALGEGVSAAWAAGALVGAVCHGGLGLLQARDETGAPLVRGRRLTAVTDKQLRELGITHTPAHPERELRAAGAIFESRTTFSDLFANCVVRDGRLVTGQNQNASEDAAWALVCTLAEARDGPGELEAA